MRKLVLVLFIALSLIGQANAKDKKRNSPFYMAQKIGLMDGGQGISDDAINAAFGIGYRNNRYLSTEVEYTTTFIDGETASGNDWNVDALSVFAALRTNTRVKLKGKVGVSSIGDDSGLEFSAGLGVSFWAAGGLTEIEYTKLGNDLNFFSIGVNFFF